LGIESANRNAALTVRRFLFAPSSLHQ